MERRKRFGVYFIFKSLEQGPPFRSLLPKYPMGDPDYRILKRQRSPYTHYYFFIRDEVLGPMALWVGSFPPLSNHLIPSTVTISSKRNPAGRAYASAKTITAFSGPTTRQPCRQRPTASARN
jgi:hypothetical protein